MEAVLLPRAARRGALRVVPGILGMTGWHRAPQKILGVMGNCDGAHILVCMSVSGIFISWEKNTRRQIFTLSNLNLIRLVCYSSLRLAILLAKWLDPVPAHIGHVTRTPSEERWCTSSWTLGTQLSAKYDNIWLDGHLNYDLTAEITKMNDFDEGSWISVIKILHKQHVCMMQQPEDFFFWWAEFVAHV